MESQWQPTPPLPPPPPPSSFSPALLRRLSAAAASGAPLRIYCDGVFDLTHLGHFRALEQARSAASAAAAAAGCGGARVHLTVGLCSDEDVAAFKGAAPILTAAERAEGMRACRWVDAVLAAPWTPTPEFLDAHGLDAIAHDDAPYPDASGAAADCYAAVKAAGRFLPTQRTQGVSTSDLIARVLKRRDELIAQCLARGVPPGDLGVAAAAAAAAAPAGGES